jgi:hypothetical protein
MRTLIILFSISAIFISIGCSKQTVDSQDFLQGSVVEIKFTGPISNGSQLSIDDMRFYFRSNDTTQNSGSNKDPLLPIILEDEPFSVSLIASTIYKKINGIWREENIATNMMPYHFAIAFNNLKAARNLHDIYELEGNVTSSILTSAVRIKNKKGEKMKVSASKDMAVQIKIIE